MKKIYFLLVSCFFLNTICSQEKLNVFDIARKGTIDQVEAIFKENPEIINTTNQHGFSPLILACYHGNEAVATFLIKHNVNLDYVSNEGTALMAAVVKGNAKIVNLLLDKSANPNLTNKHGVTALIYAVQFKNIEMINLLLQFKANKSLIDNEGKTAFEYAVFAKNDEIINLLK